MPLLSAMYSYQWEAIAYKYLARNLHLKHHEALIKVGENFGQTSL
ncbi:hypothetical protein [Anabaena subtropica]|nr:hypothetical protein [Anabaena subtropica]